MRVVSAGLDLLSVKVISTVSCSFSPAARFVLLGGEGMKRTCVGPASPLPLISLQYAMRSLSSWLNASSASERHLIEGGS
jgi:hypothetical protein